MTHPRPTPARRRLDAALGGLASTFRGMTAHPDEHNCTCHWGSAAELALLKVPDVELDPDLLRRTWQAGDWDDPAAVLRRILPQFATALVAGRIETWSVADVGPVLLRADWQRWPAAQAAAVGEFLAAWWASTLTDPTPAVPAHQVLAVVVEATGTLLPWLDVWSATMGAPADGQLADAVAAWDDLLDDELPWDCWTDDEDDHRAELADWLLRHAPTRLRAYGAPEELLHRVRLLGLTGTDRRNDLYRPHWHR
jgi:hypothetical protein